MQRTPICWKTISQTKAKTSMSWRRSLKANSKAGSKRKLITFTMSAIEGRCRLKERRISSSCSIPAIMPHQREKKWRVPDCCKVQCLRSLGTVLRTMLSRNACNDVRSEIHSFSVLWSILSGRLIIWPVAGFINQDEPWSIGDYCMTQLYAETRIVDQKKAYYDFREGRPRTQRKVPKPYTQRKQISKA